MTRLLAPLREAATYRSLLFLSTSLLGGTLALAALVTGWSLTLSLVITPLVIPALLGFRGAVGLLAMSESALARDLLGVDARAGRISSGGRGFWGRGKAVLLDRSFWREQAYLALRVVLGFPLALIPLGLIAWSLLFLSLPIYYRWTADNGIWHIDSLQEAVLTMPIGAIGLVVAAHVVRLAVRPWPHIAGSLLRGEDEPNASPAEIGRTLRKSLAVHARIAGGINTLLVLIWVLTPAGEFWPKWAMVGMGMPLAMHAWTATVYDPRSSLRHRPRQRAFAIHAGISSVLVAAEIVIWAFSGGGYFWPVWTLLALGLLLGVHALVIRLGGSASGELRERIEVLETTRAGAVDVQESELRRIERDLHDGAQARLVALGMNLGMAEQKLAADPESARNLVTEARAGVEEALRELRNLARGIHPPVLTDRGLEAAISALADRSAIPVTVNATVAERPPAPVETAAYFVAAEALTNAAKHAGATRIDVRIQREPTQLVLEVSDDGRGGADVAGTGLSGLRRRVEALDGRLTVVSPPGEGTKLRAELPCEY
jgi:signal transduction histidine kinase